MLQHHLPHYTKKCRSVKYRRQPDSGRRPGNLGFRTWALHVKKTMCYIMTPWAVVGLEITSLPAPVERQWWVVTNYGGIRVPQFMMWWDTFGFIGGGPIWKSLLVFASENRAILWNRLLRSMSTLDFNAARWTELTKRQFLFLTRFCQRRGADVASWILRGSREESLQGNACRTLA